MTQNGGKSQLLGTFLIWLVTGLLAVGIVFIAVVVSRNNDAPIESVSTEKAKALTATPPQYGGRVPRPPVEGKYIDKRVAAPLTAGEPGTLAGVLGGGYPRGLVFSGDRLNEGLRFPLDFTCYRTNKSPSISWSNSPPGTKSMALLLVRHDGEEGKGPFINWGVYNIDPALGRLGGNLPNEMKLESGALQMRNGHRNLGYTGPCEPKGKFQYSFYLFALDGMLPAGKEIEGAEFYDLLKGHVLDYNEIKVVHYLRY